ncbi:hypothetical protein ASD65_15300 [Microbacterium sp. Root61]|uniref:transglutaminase-like domain-containing protein n=1 Tax=Microbacterium sp. Root61 TaxID=1736570 RepID=UPI0007011856|nr:transglutaminase-like domain-containing protein [Microbacterium sp. Root61]KRA25630.1 hypothetical protein ASD65_15300 [Microbacterium sp. Root61]
MTGRSLPTAPVVAGTVYVLAMAAVAAVAAWPIYADPAFLIVAGAGTVAAVGIAAAAHWWRWSGWVTAGAGVLALLVLGVTLAVPLPWSGPLGLLGAVRDVVLGAVTGFKDLVTVELPVGGYRNLLVPALVVFLGGALCALLLSWRRGRVGAIAVVPAIAMVSFGLVFGLPSTSAPLVLGSVSIPAPRELATGAAALVLSLAWLSWRAQSERHAALRRAADATGVRISRRRSASDLRRAVLAGGMIVAAVAIAAVAAPAVADGRTRDVLRSAAGPELAISRALSPLTSYRTAFDDDFAQVLFQVEAVQGKLPERIRIATLSDYDGATFRVADGGSGGEDSSFLRVPSRRDGGVGESATVRIRIDGLDGIWLPTFGTVEEVDFDGADAASLADAFYYNEDARAGVETAGGGVRSGQSYLVSAVVAPEPPLETLTAPGASPAVELPDTLTAWMDAQDAGTDGAALATLVERLRSRGYLSHALAVPEEGAAWAAALPGYTFQPSASGHSLARIDTIFRQLLEREADVDGTDASLVAAIGDDEQFAVATALIAQELGFPSRVVVGARLSGADEGVPPCVDGACTGANLTAWVEVRSAQGDWVAVDVTPQHEDAADSDITRVRDPENPTEVQPESAREVVPPDPEQQDAQPESEPETASVDWALIGEVTRVVAIVAASLLLLCGPFVLVLVAKASRRRRRRSAPQAASRVVGGWDEYVDAAVDHGLPAPRAQTRSELAEQYATPDAPMLAVAADRAVFSDAALSEAEAAEFWRLVDQERHRFAAESTVWRRIVAAVSLESFTRSLWPRASRTRTTHRIERRGRAPQGEAR